MSDESNRRPGSSNDPEEPMQGVNLKLIYSLIALALVAAVTVAFFIVLPFHHPH